MSRHSLGLNATTFLFTIDTVWRNISEVAPVHFETVSLATSDYQLIGKCVSKYTCLLHSHVCMIGIYILISGCNRSYPHGHAVEKFTQQTCLGDQCSASVGRSDPVWYQQYSALQRGLSPLIGGTVHILYVQPRAFWKKTQKNPSFLYVRLHIGAFREADSLERDHLRNECVHISKRDSRSTFQITDALVA